MSLAPSNQIIQPVVDSNQATDQNHHHHHHHLFHRHALKASLDFHFKIKEHVNSITVSLILVFLVFTAVIAAALFFAVRFGLEAEELKIEVKHLKQEMNHLNESYLAQTTTKVPNHITFQSKCL